MKRRKKLLLSVLCFIVILSLAIPASSPAKAAAATIYVPDDYSTIQAAIDAATPGDTIIVRGGIYCENVVINKSLYLEAENRTAIIDGNRSGDAVRVTVSNVVIRGFTVQNAEWAGIRLDWDSNSNTIIDNVMRNNGSGIVLQDSSKNRITNNSIENNIWNGIHLVNNRGEWGNQIIGNNIIGNWNGVNSYDIQKVNPNIFYLNNFVNNTRQVLYYWSNPTDTWNSLELMVYTYKGKTYKNYLGNYWSDYVGIDASGDGIGDIPYGIYSDKDSYPLVAPSENYAIRAAIPTPPAIPTRYDREAAYDYAHTYWDKVCSDGYFFLSSYPPAYFGGGALVPSETGVDCAHFVSCCIGTEPHEKGGGLSIPSRTEAYGEPGAERLGDWLINSGVAQIQRSVKALKMGDVILYDWEGDGHWDHIALYLGQGKVAAHSQSVWNQAWQLSGAHNYRFIHIKEILRAY